MDGYGPPSSKSPFGQSTEDSKLIGREMQNFALFVCCLDKKVVASQRRFKTVENNTK
jgi:hypothetical protein